MSERGRTPVKGEHADLIDVEWVRDGATVSWWFVPHDHEAEAKLAAMHRGSFTVELPLFSAE